MPIQQQIEKEEIQALERFLKRLENSDAAGLGIFRTIRALIANNEVLMEQWIDPQDPDKNVWTRPTPWAYAQACKLRDRLQRQVKDLEEKLMSQLNQYSQAQLKQAFENVQDKQNWKNPIDCVIEDPGEENLACLHAAIIHFTGSVPVFEKKDGKVHVRAAGYYMMIGS